MKTWEKKIKANLESFLKDFEGMCQRCSREEKGIRIIFATKYLSPDQFVRFLYICKQIDRLKPVFIGENRVQEAEKKLNFLKEKGIELRKLFQLSMIGNLQKNKINKALNLFDEIQAIDTLQIAKELNKRLQRDNRKMPVFLEVNISGEEAKHGFQEKNLNKVIEEIGRLGSLELKGLMTMAPYTKNMNRVRPVFKKLKQFADKYRLATSMGMSNDWRVAIEEGTGYLIIN